MFDYSYIKYSLSTLLKPLKMFGRLQISSLFFFVCFLSTHSKSNKHVFLLRISQTFQVQARCICSDKRFLHFFGKDICYIQHK